MKTWKELRMEALGLMFSRTEGGELVTLPDEDLADFANEMMDAANYALRDMATVVPILRAVELEQEGGAGWVRYDLKALAADWMRLSPNRVTLTVGDEYLDGCDYKTEGDRYLLLRAMPSGYYTVWYEAYPECITKDTADGQVFSLAPEALDLVPIYMASRIYGDDDISMAVHYLNQYQARRGELAARAAGMADTGGGTWHSVTGW